MQDLVRSTCMSYFCFCPSFNVKQYCTDLNTDLSTVIITENKIGHVSSCKPIRNRNTY